jgi:hypothetical protein
VTHIGRSKYDQNRDDTRERPRPEIHELRAALREPYPPEGLTCDAPLAVCDATSVAFTDLVPSDLVYRDRTGETYRLRYNPAHRWFYVPEMRVDEAILIKCYDSAQDKARFTAHSAFEDPTAPKDVLPRESIELQTLAFHAA